MSINININKKLIIKVFAVVISVFLIYTVVGTIYCTTYIGDCIAVRPKETFSNNEKLAFYITGMGEFRVQTKAEAIEKGFISAETCEYYDKVGWDKYRADIIYGD